MSEQRNETAAAGNSKENSLRLAKIAIAALEDKKVVDIRMIDISEVSVLADYFIIAGGSSRTQIQALADEVSKQLELAGAEARQVEGYQNAGWVLLDFGDVIIHIFDSENRLMYDLERIWRDGKQIDPESI